ncbi:MAG: DUF805 domain-containing protein [Arenibacterium sp.]
MGFQDAVKTCFRKYATFSGRASRPEYWWFILFLFIAHLILGVFDNILFGTGSVETASTEDGVSFSAERNGPLAAIFGLATILPTIAAGWRRMHDTGRSGLYLFYPLIVVAGLGMFASFMGLSFDTVLNGELNGLLSLIFGLSVIVLAISPLLVTWWLTRPSQKGTNGYGADPRVELRRT